MSRSTIRRMFACAAALATSACGWASTSLTTQLVVSGLSQPVMVKSPPGDFQRLFVVERGGRVRMIKNGVLQATPFIDLSNEVQSSDAERGMLDIAFDPDYASNGYFYLRYTEGPDPTPPYGRTRIKRFTRSSNPDVADTASGYSIMFLASTQGFHIGGSIDFGRDGFLYVTVGDGSISANAQDINGLYGKILRIDLTGDAFPGDPDNNYRIPAGNPFAGATPGADEIWAYGLRNPFRTSFDPMTGALWIGDVGGSSFEEIDFQPLGVGGRNYGWPCKEASFCWTNQTSCNCSDPTLVAPIFEYDHNTGHCAITGGRVYRGCAIPDLDGTYFCADYCSGNIWSFRYVNGSLTEYNPNRAGELDPPGSATINSIVGFGEDARGEIYICDLGGEIFKIVPAVAPPDVNGNGIPDTCEWRPGDINHDGVVNVSDLLSVITSWGTCVGCPADIAPSPMGNGVVNVGDLLAVISNWG